jgi:hypothetical protein
MFRWASKIHTGRKTKRSGPAAFSDLREFRGLPQKRFKRRTDFHSILFGTTKIISFRSTEPEGKDQ